MDKNKSNLLNQINSMLNSKEMQMKINNLITNFSYIVQLNKAMYDEMINQGFNEIQAFKFSCDYVLSMIAPNRKGE